MSETSDVVWLCEIIGYGRVMQIASNAWGQKADVRGGNLVVGPCKAAITPCGCAPADGPCDWCCGTGWLTAHVKDLKDAGPPTSWKSIKFIPENLKSNRSWILLRHTSEHSDEQPSYGRASCSFSDSQLENWEFTEIPT